MQLSQGMPQAGPVKLQLSDSSDRQTSGEERGSPSAETQTVLTTETQTPQLTGRIESILATVRDEYLIRRVNKRVLPRLHTESMEPETPRGVEAAPARGRPASPGSPSSAQGAAPAQSGAALSSPSETAPVQDRIASRCCLSPALCPPPAQPVTCHGGLCEGITTTSGTWHEASEVPLGSSHSAGTSRESFQTAPTASGSNGSKPSSPSSASGVLSTCSTLDSLGSGPAAPYKAVLADEMPSVAESLSDMELSDDKDILSTCCAAQQQQPSHSVPACAEQGPVQLYLGVQSGPAGSPPEQHVSVRLYVTESHQGVRYVAPSCSPEILQEEGHAESRSLSLEWLRHVHVEEARQYLMDVAGVFPPFVDMRAHKTLLVRLKLSRILKRMSSSQMEA